MYNFVLSPINPEYLIEEISERVAEKVLKVINIEKTATDDDKWLNIKELCNYLPDKPSKATIYGWVYRKMIPYRRKGKVLYFKKSEIDAWLEDSKQIISKNKDTENNDEWFKISELRYYLPKKPFPAIIRSLIYSDKIPYHKINGRYYFKKSEIDAWLEEHKNKPLPY